MPYCDNCPEFIDANEYVMNCRLCNGCFGKMDDDAKQRYIDETMACPSCAFGWSQHICGKDE